MRKQLVLLVLVVVLAVACSTKKTTAPTSSPTPAGPQTYAVTLDGKTDAYVWLAPSLRYIPVKMRVVNTDRGTLEVLLRSIRVDEAKAE